MRVFLGRVIRTVIHQAENFTSGTAPPRVPLFASAQRDPAGWAR